MRKQFKRTAHALLAAKRIVLASHVNPDGDTLGCTLALTHALRAMGKDVVVLSADGVPDIYRWMPGSDWVQTATDRRDFDVAVVCDAGAMSRIGSQVRSAIESAPVLIDIDHHLADGPFGDLRILDSAAAATAELVYKLIRTMSIEARRDLTDKAVAECIMTGLITDTGSFRFMNVTPQTFDLAARMQRLGARPAVISELVFETRSFGSIKLLGRALDSLRTTAAGRVAWAVVRADDFAQYAAGDQETEGIVNHVRAVSGAMIGILLREIPDSKVRISLRGREGADVSAIAAEFGGGGHRLAAGCSIAGTLEEASCQILEAASKQAATLEEPDHTRRHREAMAMRSADLSDAGA